MPAIMVVMQEVVLEKVPEARPLLGRRTVVPATQRHPLDPTEWGMMAGGIPIITAAGQGGTTQIMSI